MCSFFLRIGFYSQNVYLSFLRSIVFGSYHHLDRFKGLPVVGWVVLCRHVVPRSPEDPIPDTLIALVVVLPIEVGRHASVEPPARAVVGAAVSRGVHVVVAVRRGEELLVVVEVLVEAHGIASRSAAMIRQLIRRGDCI